MLVSDGIEPEQAVACCQAMGGSKAPSELAIALMACGQTDTADDATVVLIPLDNR